MGFWKKSCNFCDFWDKFTCLTLCCFYFFISFIISQVRLGTQFEQVRTQSLLFLNKHQGHLIVDHLQYCETFIIIIIITFIIIIIIELTHSKTTQEITVKIEPQPAALDFKNLSQYSSRSK